MRQQSRGVAAAIQTLLHGYDLKEITALSEPSYNIDLEGVRRAFPPGIEAPPLLLDFATWLAGRPWGSVGCFDLVGQFSDHAFWDGSPLRSQFGLFMRLPTGSAVGTWYPHEFKPAVAPIVLLDSEGQWDILAASLEGLLSKIALRRFEEGSDLVPQEDEEYETDELAAWLSNRLGAARLEQFTAMPPGSPDFRGFMEKWYRDRQDYWSSHPAMASLGKFLAARRPEGKNPWERTIFEAAIVGRQYQVRVLCGGRQPIEEAAAIEPVLRGLRDDMWRADPALGLWYAMSFGMSADGRVEPNFDYETRPTINEKPADLSEARADLRRAPRPARWIPAWLTD
jgi:hypothetical protein